MKKYTLLLILCLLLLLTVPVSAESVLTNNKKVEITSTVELTGFIPDGYKYYFCEKYNVTGDYYICFFKNQPTMTSKKYDSSTSFDKEYHLSDSNNETILYYRFNTYDDMEAYLVANDASGVDYVYERDYWTYACLNLQSNNMYYSNFDVTFSDTGSSYYSKNAFSKEVTETIIGDKTYIVDTFDSDYLINNTLSDIIGILPTLLVVLVGFLGIRKVIAFLQQIIKGA